MLEIIEVLNKNIFTGKQSRLSPQATVAEVKMLTKINELVRTVNELTSTITQLRQELANHKDLGSLSR
jgi:hypothetical protein